MKNAWFLFSLLGFRFFFFFFFFFFFLLFFVVVVFFFCCHGFFFITARVFFSRKVIMKGILSCAVPSVRLKSS